MSDSSQQLDAAEKLAKQQRLSVDPGSERDACALPEGAVHMASGVRKVTEHVFTRLPD